MLVLGIDPGTAVTGYGVVRTDVRGTPTLVECGVVRTSADDPFPARLDQLFEAASELVARHRPELVAIEQVFLGKNVRSMVTLAHARAALLLAAQRGGVPIREYPPADVKKAITGTGGATKEQVAFMVTRLLRLAAPPAPADAADGVAIALTCLLRARTDALIARAVGR
ncbi:MAG: crossover junction endodeoxyribonuclease RuvC [Gemmatimonadaceae bacterium]|jgi:crossover junction endodeoxyribonuclease RuvC|nr:crossover junction endodeoxyribonuclease RuvC [Gemmatimonadaceae bacterium]